MYPAGSMAQNNVRGGYTEVESLDDAGGARAVISRRNGHALFTVAFFKTFRSDGELNKSAFFGLKNLESLERLLPIAKKRLAELEAEASAGSADRDRTR